MNERDLAAAAVRAGMDALRRTTDEAAVEEVVRSVLGAGDWVVDAIDGTDSLLRGDSFYAVTVALLEDGRPVVAATGRPASGEVWSAVAGGGSHHRLVASAARRVVLDPAESSAEHLETWTRARAALEAAFPEVELRSSIALGLALVAAGRYDGFVHVGGSPIEDFAAGVLLVGEAGGLVTAADGISDPWDQPVAIAGTPAAHNRIRDALR